MATGTGPETSRDRRALVADAGYKQLSLFSALAGAVAAVGTLAALAGAAAGIAKADGRNLEVPAQWQMVDLEEGLVVAGALAVAFLFGGYVAGRMARRAGIAHGLAVGVFGLAAGAAAYVVADLTAPLTAVVAAGAAILAGSVVGGVLGERWHAKLVARALDPSIGAEAEARRDAEMRAAEAEQLRTSSFRRARLTSPTRTHRVDQEADAVVDEDDGEPAAPASRSRARRIAPSAGRTG